MTLERLAYGLMIVIGATSILSAPWPFTMTPAWEASARLGVFVIALVLVVLDAKRKRVK